MTDFLCKLFDLKTANDRPPQLVTTTSAYICRCLVTHVVRLENFVPANSALCLMVDHHAGRKSDPSWMRRPGRPRRTWLHQQHSGITPYTMGF